MSARLLKDNEIPAPVAIQRLIHGKTEQKVGQRGVDGAGGLLRSLFGCQDVLLRIVVALGWDKVPPREKLLELISRSLLSFSFFISYNLQPPADELLQGDELS